jgi:hypothetical protein
MKLNCNFFIFLGIFALGLPAKPMDSEFARRNPKVMLGALALGFTAVTAGPSAVMTYTFERLTKAHQPLPNYVNAFKYVIPFILPGVGAIAVTKQLGKFFKADGGISDGDFLEMLPTALLGYTAVAASIPLSIGGSYCGKQAAQQSISTFLQQSVSETLRSAKEGAIKRAQLIKKATLHMPLVKMFLSLG